MPVSPDQIMSVVMKSRPRLHGYAWVVTGDPDLAEDVLQEVSLLALQKAEGINDETHLLGWLHESIRRQGLAARRVKMSQAMQLSSEVLAMLAEVQVDQHNASHTAQVKALRQCMELLGDKSRDTLAMRYGDALRRWAQARGDRRADGSPGAIGLSDDYASAHEPSAVRHEEAFFRRGRNVSEQQQQPLDPQDIEAYLLGCLTDDRVEALDKALRSDPAALRQFAHAMQVMSLVRQEFAGQAQYHAANAQEPLLEDFNSLLKQLGEYEAAAEPITLAPVISPQHQARIDADKLTLHELVDVGGYVLRKALTSKPAIYTGLGTAAAAVLLLALILLNPFADETPDSIAGVPDEVPSFVDDLATPTNPVATLTATHNAQWAQPSAERALARGSSLHAGQTLTLTAGSAEITTLSGAVAILKAPATVELIDNNNALRLHAGKLVGICETESSKGFLVRTPHMDVTDLGTRFGVDTSQPDATEVHVFEGKVSAVMPRSVEPAQILTTGQAVRASGASDTLVAITPSIAPFADSMGIHILPGTGVGLAAGDTDPNWRIVAIDGKALDQPLFFTVTDASYAPGPPQDPALGQWLMIARKDSPGGIKSGRQYTVEREISIPQGIDLNRSTLNLDSEFDNNLDAMRINGQAVEVPNATFTRFRRFKLSASPASLGLTHGNNTVQFDIQETIPHSATALFLTWHIDTNLPDQP